MDVATNWTGLEASGSAECFNFSLMSTLTKPNWHEQPRKIKWTAKKRYWSTRASGLGGVAGGSWWLIQILNTWIRLYLAFKLFKLTNAHTHSSQSYKTGCQGVCHAHMSLFFFFFPCYFLLSLSCELVHEEINWVGFVKEIIRKGIKLVIIYFDIWELESSTWWIRYIFLLKPKCISDSKNFFKRKMNNIIK